MGSLSNNQIAKSFYANAVCPGLVFIEKLQNNDLMMTSFAALRRPYDVIWFLKVSRMTSFMFLLILSEKNIWLLNIQFPWMIHCTNLNRFPQYLKCPKVNHSITYDENSPRPPCERPGIPSRGPASLWVTSSVSKWGGGTLGKCSKGSSFFLGMTSLSQPRVCYQRNKATPLSFFLN